MYLERGDVGNEVGQLQRDLNFCAYDAGAVDNDFGGNTESAVISMQAFHGLEQDGIYGDLSDAALMSEIKPIQQALVNNGYVLKVDGAVGQDTLNSAGDFQARKGLTVDRIVGNQTLAALGLTGNTTPQPAQPTPSPVPNPGTGAVGSGNVGVFFSPSKQPDNIYTVSGISEQQYCEDLVANYIIPELESRGGRGYTNNGAGVLNGGRNATSNQLYAEGKISFSMPIHTNAGGGQGVEIFCNPDSGSIGYQLSQKLLNNIVALGRPNRGLKNAEAMDLYEYEVDAPVAYTEIDYHDSVEGCNFLLNNRESIAIAFVNAIYAQANS